SAIIPIAAILWVATAYLAWANWYRRRTAAAAAMEGLRLITMSFIALTLLKPEFVRKIVQTEAPEITILTDTSESMKTRDVVLDSSSVVQRDEWLDQARRTNFWKPLEAAAKVRIEDFAVPSTNNSTEAGTDINATLEQTLQRRRNLKAVLLLSDGDWNIGKSPISAASAYRIRKVPIYTVSVGS